MRVSSGQSISKKKTFFQRGLTMIEVLIVVAILALLGIIAFTNAPTFIARGNDGRRKSDLQELKIALEQYYADNQCYPPPSIFDTCGTKIAEMASYLPKMPCDPVTGQPYVYSQPEGQCKSFYLYTKLWSGTDPDSARIGCDNGCGPDGSDSGTSGDYNFGVSSDNASPGTTYYVPDGGLCVPNQVGGCIQPYICNSAGNLCVCDALNQEC